MARKIDGMVVIITGASAGIGRAMAQAMHARGAKLVLAARRLDVLEKLNSELGHKHLCVKCDVSIERDCFDLIERTISRFNRIDTLVCNAGYGLVRRVHEATHDETDQLFKTNVYGTTNCIRAAVPHILKNEITDNWRGQLMLMSSAAARRGLPMLGGYAATKASQLMLAESARVELKQHRIAVTSVHPIGTESDFLVTAESVSQFKINPKRRGRVRQTSESVALKTIRAIEKPSRECWPFWPARYALALASICPAFGDYVMGRQLKVMEKRQA
ncbi:MAG TPA: SDR family oxidoreductase [Tepidisphaeraceae bacterium]|nr:SDR family oxidoreductase [Tepidisphaeraceae bacterium]